jgi:hypothetical protein
MNREQVYSFVFKGFLTKERLDTMGVKQRVVDGYFEEDSFCEMLSLDLLDDDHLMTAKKMSMIYCAIAAFENSVRAFVTKKMLEEKGESWWADCVSEKIRTRAESRMQEESKVRWHTQRGDQPLNYTDFSELISIMVQNWPLFEPHLNSVDWVNGVLKPLERSRNVIMHSGELGREDVQRVGSCIRDWIKQVGN